MLNGRCQDPLLTCVCATRTLGNAVVGPPTSPTNDAEVAMTEKERFDLYEQLIDWLGPVHAGILMENLPPISWDQIATKDDVHAVRDDFRDAIGLLGEQMGAQGTALRGEMSELRGDLRTEMSELRSDMSDFRTELRTEMSDFQTESGSRLNQLEERISDKISSAQRQNLALTVAMMLSIWLSIAAF